MTDTELLAKTLYLEAADQPFEGQCAVAMVILERVRDRRWSDTIRGVILQPHQFSCWSGRDPECTKIVQNKSSEKCGLIAHMVEIGTFRRYLGDQLPAFNHYYNPDLCSPPWKDKMTDCQKIGDHIFGIIA